MVPAKKEEEMRYKTIYKGIFRFSGPSSSFSDQQEVKEDLKEDNDEEEVEESEKGVTKTVEDGAFTITSTIGLETDKSGETEAANLETKFSQLNIVKGPSPRFGAQLAMKQGTLYLFGGLVEDSNDRQFTHKDLYSLGKDFNNEKYVHLQNLYTSNFKDI